MKRRVRPEGRDAPTVFYWLLATGYWLLLPLPIPPAAREEPEQAGREEEEADGGGGDARRDPEAVERLARGVVRRGHRQGHQHQLGGEDAAAELVLDRGLQEHGREDPQHAPARVRDRQPDQREREALLPGERDVEAAREEERDADGALHLLARLAVEAAREQWADGGADAARRVERAHAERRAADGRVQAQAEDLLAEDGQQ